MSPCVIRNARVIDPESDRDEQTDILVEDGHIAAIGHGFHTYENDIDATGLIAAPGLVDMRVITGEPGTENCESIASAAKAAAAGGVTTIVIMPDTNPVIDDMSLVNYVQRKGEDTDIKIQVAGALTKGLDGRTLTEIGLMSQEGAVMFSSGATPITNALTMRRILSYSAGFNALVANRAKDPALTHETCVHESDFSARLGLTGAPSIAERIMVERDVALAELTGGRLLIDMISSQEALAVVRRAKMRDVDIACSVSINHLCLNENDIGDYRTFAKLDPPLRDETDRLALLQGVGDGTIDVIVSAHDPRPAGEKRLPFEEASPGAVGLELLLAAGLSQVADNALDLMTYLRAVTLNPADLLDLPQGRLSEGAPADIVLFDPDKPWVVDSDALVSQSNNTPFDDSRLTGKAVVTICDGRVVAHYR
ncbi:MAG: dihydroorotase [Hyphomonadaceae bacterium]|nr:dihydroorotase [Hyphomonadaceae bacterium]MBC6413259.1 dihydroorotase [Hyphomonadaceae bacterium]